MYFSSSVSLHAPIIQTSSAHICPHDIPSLIPPSHFFMVFSLLIFRVRIIGDIRRQFRSPTFRQYGQMKSRDGKREKKKEDKKRESLRRKKIQVRGKVGKSRNTVFFQWFVAPEGRKVGSLKRRGAEPAGQMRDEKLHAVVARSTFPSQNVQNTSASERF